MKTILLTAAIALATVTSASASMTTMPGAGWQPAKCNFAVKSTVTNVAQHCFTRTRNWCHPRGRHGAEVCYQREERVCVPVPQVKTRRPMTNFGRRK